MTHLPQPQGLRAHLIVALAGHSGYFQHGLQIRSLPSAIWKSPSGMAPTKGAVDAFVVASRETPGAHAFRAAGTHVGATILIVAAQDCVVFGRQHDPSGSSVDPLMPLEDDAAGYPVSNPLLFHVAAQRGRREALQAHKRTRAHTLWHSLPASPDGAHTSNMFCRRKSATARRYRSNHRMCGRAFRRPQDCCSAVPQQMPC